MNPFLPHIALYRLFDLADEIDLARLGTPRLRLSRPRLGAVRFQNPPAQLELGVRSVEGVSGLLTARLYEFGVASLSFRVHLGERLPWEAFVEKALAMPELPFWEGFLWRSWPLWSPTSKGPSSAPRRSGFPRSSWSTTPWASRGPRPTPPPVDLTPL